MKLKLKINYVPLKAALCGASILTLSLEFL